MLSKLKARYRILLGFSVPIILMVIVAIVVYANIAGLIETAAWVDHTHEVIADTRELGKLIVDMETGERGFLITGDESFLDPFNESQNVWDENIAQLKILVSDNSVQLSRLDVIDKFAKQWLSIAARPEIAARIECNETGTPLENVIVLVNARTGKQIIDTLRVELNEFIKAETELMEFRDQQSKDAASKTILVTILGTALAVLFVLLSALLVSAKIAGSLGVLVERTREISTGNLTREIKVVGDDEFAVLAGAFNSMTKELQKSRNEIVDAKKYVDNILHYMMDMLIVLDPDGKIRTVNQATLDILGYSENDLVGKNINLLIEGEEDFQRGLIQKGIIGRTEKMLLVKDTRKVPVLLSGAVMRSESNAPEALVLVATDITERRQSEDALRESEALFRSQFEHGNIGIAISTADKGWVRANQQVINMFGYSEEELLKTSWTEITHPDDLAADLAQFNRMVAGEIENYHMDKRFMCKDGHIIYTHLGVSCFRNLDRTVRFAIATIQDLTERIQAEENLRQAQKIESVGILAGGIAHEFNNILGGMMNYSQLAMDDTPENSQARDSLDEIMKLGWRATEMIQQILVFSLKSEQKREAIKLHTVIEESLKLLQGSIPTSIEIRQHVDENTSAVNIDHAQMRQVLTNLYLNAAQAMQENGGTLEIALNDFVLEKNAISDYPDLPPGPYVQLTVSDTGSGIDPETTSKVFDPYFTTKAVGKGTGMGLSVAYGIIKKHNGAMTVKSELGQGTAFTILLPGITGKQLNEKQPDQSPPTGTERILIIDDDQMIIESLQRMLERLGYSVTSFTNPLEVIEIFKKTSDEFDLVITDQTMPEISGTKLAEQLIAIRQDIPVIISSGTDTMSDTENLAGFGIKASITKPYSRQTVAKLIRSVLENKMT